MDTTTVPIWLSLDATNGVANTTGVTINFTPSAIAASLGAGTFGASVHLLTSGNQDALVAVTLVVKDAPSTLSVNEGLTQNITWTKGAAYPTSTLTLVSSDQPISTTIVATVVSPTTPANWLVLNHASAVAYSWGTPISITFLQQALDNATVGTNLTANVAITPAGGSALTVAYTITVAPPVATITSIYPKETPVVVAISGTVNVVVTGTGFVPSGVNATTIGIRPNGLNGQMLLSGVTVVNSNTILVALDMATYTGAAADLYIDAWTGGTSPYTSTGHLIVTTDPIVYTITDTASYVEAAPGANGTVAPYELISIFGDNFGPTAGSPVSATVDSFGRYPKLLADGNGHNVTVNFFKGSDGTTAIPDSYLLFISNNQINALVPAGVVGNATVKISVTDGSNTSTQYTANVAAANPGVFTVSASGQGQGAILHSDYSVNSSSHAAAKGSTVLIYVSGLGVPNSTSANTASSAAGAFPGACISAASYMSTVNTASSHPSPTWTTIDGAVILASNLATNRFAPCFTTPVTVTIGGKSATVSYAGFVAGSVAGLYQINATVPTTVTTSSTAPVVVTIGTAPSQAGVTMAVQ